MKTIFEIFISDASYARPSRLDPPSLPYTDILIGIAALMGTVGSIVFIRFLYRKWKNQRYNPTLAGPSLSRKHNLTQHEKRALTQKIQETRTSNLKKTFAGKDSSKGMIFATIGLILLTMLFVIGMIVLRFRKF